MGTFVQGADLRQLNLGYGPVSKATGTLAASTVSLYTIAGGLVLVTSLVGIVTTAITVANSYKLQIHPTAGDTLDLCAATDLGTVDTTLGDVLGVGGAVGIVKNFGISEPMVLPVGTIESVSTGTDGAITWYATWYPYQTGATLVAA